MWWWQWEHGESQHTNGSLDTRNGDTNRDTDGDTISVTDSVANTDGETNADVDAGCNRDADGTWNTGAATT